jgi:hypothetical protein
MGILTAMRYPTSLALGAADHTYVRCGTGGKALSCWGGKTGGGELRSAAGSSARADAIATPNERARITCYLVNGVCHQAANRILFPAAITFVGARGYGVSEALFGTYGRPNGALGLCRAPFDQHAGTTGDLPECVAAAARTAPRKSAPFHEAGAQAGRHRAYVKRVQAEYESARHLFEAGAPAGTAIEEFQLELFRHQARHRLGTRVKASAHGRLLDIRRSTERSRMMLETWFAKNEIRHDQFVAAFNEETRSFQRSVAAALPAPAYKSLFDLKPGQTVVLADPAIVAKLLDSGPGSDASGGGSG